MNRILFSLLLACSVLSAVRIEAQSFTYQFAADDESLSANVPLNEISARAFRNFIKCYGYISGTIWQKQQGGYSVRFFTFDSVLHIVHYDHHGRPGDTHAYYTAKNAPAVIRSMVNNLYAGYTLQFVNEVGNDTGIVFEIGLLKNDQLRIVEEKDGEIKSNSLLTGYQPPESPGN